MNVQQFVFLNNVHYKLLFVGNKIVNAFMKLITQIYTHKQFNDINFYQLRIFMIEKIIIPPEIQDNSTNKCCIFNNQAEYVCISAQCQDQAFICRKQKCKCFYENHKACAHHPLSDILSILSTKTQQPSESVEQMLQVLEKIYNEAIEKLSIAKQQINLTRQFYGLQPHQMRLMFCLKQGACDKNITGSFMNKVMQQIKLNKFLLSPVTQDIIRKQIKEDSIKLQLFISKLQQRVSYIQTSPLTINSNITKSAVLLESFIGRKVKSFQLLYRGSYDFWNSAVFHIKCDNRPNTLTLIQTQFDKKIGGFTTQFWDSTNKVKKDLYEESFLFSISNNEKYRRKQKQKAIFCHSGFGPIFGNYINTHLDTDLFVECGNSNNCGSNFPKQYVSGYNYGTDQQARIAFIGNKETKFTMKQCEVFQVIFE